MKKRSSHPMISPTAYTFATLATGQGAQNKKRRQN